MSKISKKINSLCYIFVFSLVLLGQSAFTAEEVNQNIPKNVFPTKYISEVDQKMTIKSVTVFPGYDNVDLIYAKALNEYLVSLIKEDPMWSYQNMQGSIDSIRPDDLDTNSKFVLDILNQSSAQAMFSFVLIKGAQGIKLDLNLYTQDQGYLLLTDSLQEPTVFEVEKVKAMMKQLYTNIKTKLPFAGYVTHRRGTRVIVNRGSDLGYKAGDQINVVQILKINRHPKLRFMTGTEKEIIGRIRLDQVESNASYGEINFEKEVGVIDRGSKFLVAKVVPGELDSATTDDRLNKAFPNEKNPIEWLPTPAPQFGKVTLLGGFGNFSDSSVLRSGTSISANSSFSPAISLGVEFWLTPSVYSQLNLSQMFFTASNGLGGSTPTNLNYTVGVYDLIFGYRYLITGQFWGPHLNFGLGYLSHTTRVSDSSPVSFTSFELNGFDLVAGGYFPVTEKYDVAIGAQVKLLLFKHLSESPVDSGSSDPTYNQFEIYGTYQYTTNINFKGSLQFENIQSNFSGGATRSNPARSLDEKTTSYLFGIEYLF